MRYELTYAHVLVRAMNDVIFEAFESKPRPEQVAALDKFGANVRALVEADPELSRLLFRKVPRDG
jgi:hypothetical protein